MSDTKIEVGTIVHHPKRPGWGPGKALAVGGGGQVTVYFRDLEEAAVADAVKTISTTVVGLEIADEQSDPMLDNLPPFSNGRFEGVRKPRLNLDAAAQAFLDKNPNGFDQPPADDDGRSKLDRAHEMWMDGLGGDQLKNLLDEGKLTDVRRLVLNAIAKTDLLTSQENGVLEEALSDEEIALPFLRAVSDVIDASVPEQPSFQRLIDAASGLPEKRVGVRFSPWAMMTLLPFIACPEQHAFFKTSTVQKCAARLNFDLRYNAGPNWWTYDRLLEMEAILLDRLKPMGARDFFDVQSFVEAVAKA